MKKECYGITIDLDRDKIHGQVVVDYTNNRIIINDNFCGIPEQSLQPIWDSGKKISKARRTSGAQQKYAL